MKQNSLATEHKPLSIPLFAAILLIASLANVTSGMYVPALPIITQVFRSNATAIQLTLTAFLLGFSMAHLVYGPISDRIGRRLPILTGIGFSVVGSIFCLFANSVTILTLGRFLQGIGVAACNSVGRSMILDLLTGAHFAKIGSYLGMVVVFVTATAPTLGGYIQHYFNWRVIFLFLLIYTIFVWFFAWKVIPETNQDLNPNATKSKILLQNYLKIISHKSFLGYTLCVSFAYAGLIAFMTNGPFLLQTVVGLTPVQYGWLSFVTGSAIFLSFFINSKCVIKIGIERSLVIGISLMTFAGIIMLLFAAFGFLNVFVIMLPVAIFCTGVGFAFANGSAGALQHFGQLAGSAAALFGCLQILGGVIASAFIAKLHFNNQIPLGLVYLCCGIFSWLAWLLARKKYRDVVQGK